MCIYHVYVCVCVSVCVCSMQIGVPAVPGYLGQMLPPNTPQPTIDEVQQTFLQFACAMDKDIPATEVVVRDTHTHTHTHTCRHRHT